MTGLVRLDIWHHPTAFHLARPVADMLRAAGAAPRMRAGSDAPAECDGLIVLLSTSPTSRCWLDAQRIETVFAQAAENGVPVLPIRVEDCEVPEALRDLSFADYIGRNRETEEQRVLITLAEMFGADRISAPPLASDIPTSPPLYAIRLRYGAALDRWVDPRFVQEQLPMMQDGLLFELGVPFPDVCLEQDADLPPMAFAIDLFDVEEIVEQIPDSQIFVGAHPRDLQAAGYPCQPASNPANGHLFGWVDEAQADALAAKGLPTWDAAGWIVLRLSALLRYRASTFLDQTTVAALLGAIRPHFPRLVDSTVPGALSLADFTDVLRRLVFEAVSVRNLRRILIETAEIAAYEDRPDILAEYLRAAMKDQLTHTFSRGQGHVAVILLDPSLEDLLREGMAFGQTSSWFALEAPQLAPVLDGLSDLMAGLPAGVQAPLILTPLEIRAAVRRLIAPSFPTIHTISYADLEPTVNIQPIGRIGPNGVEMRAGVGVERTVL